MRIIAGRHRGRKLFAPKGTVSRPTADRAREALFSILTAQGLLNQDATVLDCYAGTGAVGLEALSRGAATALFIERDPHALEALARNVEVLDEHARCWIVRTDALHPPPASHPCTLVFLDPPYGKNLVAPTLDALIDQGWAAKDATIVAEVAAAETPPLPASVEVTDERTYGAAKFLFMRMIQK